MQGLFLSTLSLRRATIPDREPAAGYLISIHALLAESDPTRWAPTCRISNFYPRSPCGERLVALLATGRAGYFYPRSPCGERPNHFLTVRNVLTISIHALLAESDREIVKFSVSGSVFLSTLSLRRATKLKTPCVKLSIISIHALLAESDAFRSPRIALMVGFLSTLSLRRATPQLLLSKEVTMISIHALLAESDACQ